MNKHVLLILFLAFVFSCNSTDESATIIDIESTLIAKGDLFGNGAEGISEQQLVINDQSTWNNLIAQMDSVNNESNSFSEIDIDFSEYIVIAVFYEIKANGGYDFQLHITSNSETIFVTIIDLNPGGNATNVITQPYHIVKIPISNLPIIFQ